MAPPAEQKEAHAEQPETPPPFQDKEIPYDEKLPWRSNARNLLLEALDKKYHEKLNTVLQDVDEAKLNEVLADVKTVELKDAVLIFKDAEKKTLYSIDLRNGLTEARKEIYRHDCALCQRRSRRLRIYEFRHTSYSDMLMRLMASRGLPEGKRVKRGRIIEPPDDPLEVAANERWARQLGREKVARQDLLDSVMTTEGEEFDLRRNTDRKTRDLDAREFEQHWRDLDFSHEVDELLTRDANPEGGYRVNPFKQLKWNHETIRNLIQEGKNDRIYFKEVVEKIYNERYKEFKQKLAADGIPKVVLDLLDKERGTLGNIPIIGILEGKERPDDITQTFKRLKRIAAELAAIKDPKKVPAKYKELYPHREKLGVAIQILGDYIAYSARLVHLIGKLRYNPAKRTQDRERLMMEFEYGPDGRLIKDQNTLAGRRNRIKTSLHELFVDDVETPREYSSECYQIWADIKSIFTDDPNREITFQDLNGQTLSLKGEWFTETQSSITAYKFAYEAIEGEFNEKTGEPEINENIAVGHFNELLKLGVSAYTATPHKRSMKQIMDSLNAAGVEVEPGVPLEFGNGIRADATNLIHVLEIKSLVDLQKSGSEKDRLIRNERIKFIRIGSVVWQHNQVGLQKHREQAREREKQKTVVVKLKEEQAEAILAKLEEKRGQLDPAKREMIKRTLIGGVAVILGEKPGVGAFLRYDLGDGWSLTFTGGGGAFGGFGGVGLGKRIEITDNVEISLHAGPGFVFGETSGPTVGGGAVATWKFEHVDFSIHGGAGVLFSGKGIGPGVSLGVGLDWGKYQEKAERAITKREAETHIDELDKVADKYAAVKANPDKYPEMAELLYRIENASSLLDAESQRIMFETTYAMFKQGIESEAVAEAGTSWWDRVISGFNVGISVVYIPGTAIPIPIPYAALEFQLWRRKTVIRIATDAEKVGRATEAEATAALLRQVGGDTKVEKRTLAATGELLWDPESKKLLLKSVSGSGIDFKEIYDKFPQFQNALSKDAKIFVEHADIEGQNYGLLLLKPREAHGVTEIYVDPELKDDVIITTRGARLYISVKKDREIFFRREDVTYPFEHRGATETSTIVITANPHVRTDLVKRESPWFMEQQPGAEWIWRPRTTGATPEARREKTQENFKKWEDYLKWWGEGRSDRLASFDVRGYHESYDKLVDAVTLTNEHEAKDMNIRPEVLQKIEALCKDDSFIREYREKSSPGFHMLDAKKMEELQHFVEGKIGLQLNASEFNTALVSFTIASFQDLKKRQPEEAKKQYDHLLDNFHLPLFKKIFASYYEETIKDETERNKKADEMAKWIIDRFRNIDLAAKGTAVEAGTLFATLVGMPGLRGKKVVGIRGMYNFHDSGETYGMLGKQKLNPAAKDISGEAARFWIETLSPYVPGLQKKAIPPPEQPQQFNEYQDQMFENLHSPLALKLAPLFAVTLTPTEMDHLTKIYQGRRTVPQRLITKENLPTVKKFLDFCDRVREAELRGDPKKFDLGNGFFLIITSAEVSQGIYRRCGNPSGLFVERFALIYEYTKQQLYFAAMSEEVIDVIPGYKRADVAFPLGLAIPLPQKREVTARPERPQPKPGPEPTQGPGPKPHEPPPTVVESAPTPAESGSTRVSGGTAEGTTTTAESGTAGSGGGGE